MCIGSEFFLFEKVAGKDVYSLRMFQEGNADVGFHYSSLVPR